MPTDKDSNRIFLSDKLQKDHPIFTERFYFLLHKCGFQVGLLKETKDIWCRDYMPLQIDDHTFVQFRYEPSYLDFKKYRDKKTNGKAVFPLKDVTVVNYDINLDGGNVISCSDCVIVTNRIFKENKDWRQEELLAALEKLLKIRVVVIPSPPYDFTGHADGAVRYYRDKTVLINDYKNVTKPSEKQRYEDYDLHLRMALRNAGLKYERVPCYPGENTNDTSAFGYYINFLRMGDIVFLPSFGKEEQDADACQCFKKLFQHVIPVPCREIAAMGGVLNCISWTIKQ